MCCVLCVCGICVPISVVSLQVPLCSPLTMLFVIAPHPTLPLTHPYSTCLLPHPVTLPPAYPAQRTLQAVAADGVSFAIPTDAVREIVRQFHQHGRVIRPFIGITMLEVSNGVWGGKVPGQKCGTMCRVSGILPPPAVAF